MLWGFVGCSVVLFTAWGCRLFLVTMLGTLVVCKISNDTFTILLFDKIIFHQIVKISFVDFIIG